MALFLHLTDLHLGPVLPRDSVDDHKRPLVPPKERTTRQALIEHTIEALGRELQRTGKKLDAILITGDITSYNDEQGFQDLSGLLDKLGASCPPTEQIVVIPGNHDVAWTNPPSSEERYARFLACTRQPDRPYITSLLEGIDLDTSGHVRSAFKRHYLLSPNHDWLIVPMNSANYCGTIEPSEAISDELWNALAQLRNDSSHVDIEAIRKEVDRLRLHDVARISLAQFEGVGEILRAADAQVREEGGDPTTLVRIALIHHQLLPVSLSEEVKSFESITNLGLLRTFLREHGFNMVLHGHKHQGLIYYDDIPDVQGGAGPQRVLVVSGATIDGENINKDVCRLIELDADPFIPRADITGIPARQRGLLLDILTLPTHSYTLPRKDEDRQGPHTTSALMRGKTLDEVYTRLLDLWERLRDQDSRYLYNVVCRLDQGSTASILPKNYPYPIVDEADRQRWLDDIVNWWQRRESKLSKQWNFTHGSRIYAYGEGKNIDQVKNVVNVLKKKETSSRAVITLLLPPSDKIDEEQTKFPSFCLVQFAIRTEKSKQYLDCVGYFRKQELRYWWPINIVELARLQQTILSELLSKMPGLSLGSITTITAIGYAGVSLPKVAVPAIDRALDDQEDLLWSLTYALFWPALPKRQEMTAHWEYFLDDLIPPQNHDPDGVPIATDGIEYIFKLSQRFANCHPSIDARNLLEFLKQLLKLNKTHQRLTADDIDNNTHTEWRGEVEELVERIKREVKILLSQPEQ